MTKPEVLTPAWMESVVLGAGLVTIMLPVSTQLENSAVLAIGKNTSLLLSFCSRTSSKDSYFPTAVPV